LLRVNILNQSKFAQHIAIDFNAYKLELESIS
jgi:hypothetical protein